MESMKESQEELIKEFQNLSRELQTMFLKEESMKESQFELLKESMGYSRNL